MKTLLATFGAWGLAMVAHAQGGSGDPAPQLENPLGTNKFEDLVERAIDWLIMISAPILVIVIIWGAFLMMTAGGNENKYTQGKKTITYAVIGFAVILLARGLIIVVKEFLGVN